MDKSLVLIKLQSLARCVDRIELKRPADPAVLRSDCDLQDILSVNLERAVQACVDLAAHLIADTSRPAPETMAECFTELRAMGVLDHQLAERLRKAVGFRNIAVHEYREIEWDIVFSIVTRDLDDFRAFARAVMVHCGMAP